MDLAAVEQHALGAGGDDDDDENGSDAARTADRDFVGACVRAAAVAALTLHCAAADDDEELRQGTPPPQTQSTPVSSASSSSPVGMAQRRGDEEKSRYRRVLPPQQRPASRPQSPAPQPSGGGGREDDDDEGGGDEDLPLGVPEPYRRSFRWMKRNPEYFLVDIEDDERPTKDSAELLSQKRPIPESIRNLNRDQITWVMQQWLQFLSGRLYTMPWPMRNPLVVLPAEVAEHRRGDGSTLTAYLVGRALFGQYSTPETHSDLRTHYLRWLSAMHVRFGELTKENAGMEKWQMEMNAIFHSCNVLLGAATELMETLMATGLCMGLADVAELHALNTRGGNAVRASIARDPKLGTLVHTTLVSEQLHVQRALAVQEIAIIPGVDSLDPMALQPVTYGPHKLRTGVYKPCVEPDTNPPKQLTLRSLIRDAITAVPGGITAAMHGNRGTNVSNMVDLFTSRQPIVELWKPNRTVFAFPAEGGAQILYFHNNPHSADYENRPPRFGITPRSLSGSAQPSVFFGERQLSPRVIGIMNDLTLPFLSPDLANEGLAQDYDDWMVAIDTPVLDSILQAQYPTYGDETPAKTRKENAITQRLLLAMLGRVLQNTKSCDNWQRMLVVMGVKRTGKSTLFNAVKRWFPSEHVATLTSGGDPSFGLDGLQNAWVVMIDELKRFKMELDELLQAISGNTVNVGRKFKSQVSIGHFMAHLFACGNPPFPVVLNDPAHALGRRVLGFPFNVPVPHNAPIVDLEGGMQAESGMVMLKCAKALQALYRDLDVLYGPNAHYSDSSFNNFLADKAPWLLEYTAKILEESSAFSRFMMDGPVFTFDPDRRTDAFKAQDFTRLSNTGFEKYGYKMPYGLFQALLAQRMQSRIGGHTMPPMEPTHVREALLQLGCHFVVRPAHAYAWPFKAPDAITYTGEWLVGVTIQRHATEATVTPEIMRALSAVRSHPELDPCQKLPAPLFKQMQQAQKQRREFVVRMSEEEKLEFESIRGFLEEGSPALFLEMEGVEPDKLTTAELETWLTRVTAFQDTLTAFNTARKFTENDYTTLKNNINALYATFEAAYEHAHAKLVADAEEAVMEIDE
jgi:hypothetical protein